MAIKGKSVRAAERILLEAHGAAQVRFGVRVQDLDAATLKKIGLAERPIAGDQVLPGVAGRVTEFNANGREIVRRDLPMEAHSVGSFRSWRDWHGQTHSGIQYRDVKSYPRDLTPPPGEELHALELDDGLWMVTRVADLETETTERLLHLANLMLECFGHFEVIDARGGNVVQRRVRTLSWEVLPRGRYPWEKARPVLEDLTRTLRDSERPVVEERWRAVTAYQPTFIAKGAAGFAGYVVFGFPERELFLLESAHLGNATYVFDENWEELSGMTKADIIQGKLARARITHGRTWRTAIHRLLGAG